MAQSGIPALPQPRAGHPLPSGSLYRFRRAERRTRLPGAFSRCSTAVGTTTVHRKRGDGRTGLTLTQRFRFSPRTARSPIMVPVPQSHLSGDNVGGPPMTSSPQLRPLGEPTFAWIGRVFAEHPVLAFRDQNLGAAELAAFGRRFGSPRMHALVKYRHAEYPEVSWLTNVEDDGKVDWYGVKRATDWHTDSTYEADPPILAILHAKEIPSSKGGTMFADMRAAYDALPKTMKDR